MRKRSPAHCLTKWPAGWHWSLPKQRKNWILKYSFHCPLRSKSPKTLCWCPNTSLVDSTGVKWTFVCRWDEARPSQWASYPRERGSCAPFTLTWSCVWRRARWRRSRVCVSAGKRPGACTRGTTSCRRGNCTSVKKLKTSCDRTEIRTFRGSLYNPVIRLDVWRRFRSFH